MEILENRIEWAEDFKTGWLAHLEATGEMDWSLYNRPKNTQPCAGKAIDLSKSKLLLISSAGAYLAASQAPFFDSDDTHPLGDYSIRTFSAQTNFDDIAIAHSHYPHDAINIDHQVQLPLGHLTDMVSEGLIGSLADTVVNYAGYQPVATDVVDKLLPAILEVVEQEQPDAVLLVPS